MNNKAQVTIFIILGLIILATAGIFIYTSTTQQKEEIAPGVFIAVQDIPTELDPISKYVSVCLEDIATKGLKLVGEHGGYVDMDNRQLNTQNFKISKDPTESEAVIFAPNSKLKIPYWWYLESNNKCEGTCSFTSKRPELRIGENSIEKQLNRFIEKELPTCLNNFNDIKEEGFEIKELSPIRADTKITVSDIVVILDYKLEVKKSDVNSNIEQFFTRIPVNLEKIYNLATDITNLQQEFRFLERQTMNLISAFASVDENKLPPITDLRFEFGSTTTWLKSDVKAKITQVLMSYIPLFQVDGSRNFNRDIYSSELQQRLYDGLIIPIADQQYSNLDVTFNYLDFWPVYFDLNCNGEICQAESASSNKLKFIGLQKYDFVYDISYPVMVEIIDKDALNNRGYRFNFFLESNVRNNKQLESNFAPLQTATLPGTTLLCNLDNRNSANVTIEVLDSVNLELLDGVSITFTIADESCYIGRTDETGSLVTKFPTGTVGAVVTLIKPDYLSESKLFDARIDRELSLQAKLDPIMDKKIIVKKKLVEKTPQGWTFTNRVSDLKLTEEAFVTLTRITSLEEEEFSTIASLTGPNEADVKLAPGEYEISINMFLRENLRIPEKKKKVVKGLLGLFDDTKITFPEVNFDEKNPYPSGGLKLNIVITKEDLTKDTLVLYAVSPDLPNVPEDQRVISDLEQIGKIEEYSNVYASLLKPIFQ